MDQATPNHSLVWALESIAEDPSIPDYARTVCTSAAAFIQRSSVDQKSPKGKRPR